MYLKRVPQLKSNSCLYAIYLMSVVSMMIGQVFCDSSYSNHMKKIPISGSGSGGGGSAGNLQKRSSYAVISQAMQQTIISNNEFESAPSGSCNSDDDNCPPDSDYVEGLEAIRSLHRQLDDDENGDIDLSESDDFLREELKYEGGYEKRHRAFHFNDDMHISVKELWEAWLKSEVHNWTLDQTCEWLIQSVQLPQYVNLFKKHKITGKVLPRLAVNNLHFVSNILGIKDPIHKQKIALKAMDAVLFGPPRETGTRWKDIVLVTLLLTAIIGSWYAYQQNKNAKGHLKRMAREMENLHKAEKELTKMQQELENARIEQENVGKEKQDLERRLKEAPIKSSSSEMELQQLKQEIELLRNELSRAEVELIDHHWSPPQGLQLWIQLTYELETKNHQKKRMAAEKQLMQAREACEKLKKKRSSFVGAFVSTHGKSIDDVDRTIVDARNSLSEVTNELQERLHRWKQIETLLGCQIVNNNGIAYLENMLYRSNGTSSKSSRGRISSSQDDLDDESLQGFLTDAKYLGNRDVESSSDEDHDSVTFILGGTFDDTNLPNSSSLSTPAIQTFSSPSPSYSLIPITSSVNTINTLRQALISAPTTSLVHQGASFESNSTSNEETRSNISSSSERFPPPPPRAKKQISLPLQNSFPITSTTTTTSTSSMTNRTPMPPPRSNPLFHSCKSTSYLESMGSISALPAATTFADNPISTTALNSEQNFKISSIAKQNNDDNQSSASSSSDDTNKKRKRRLFTFGKKSSKSKSKNS